MDALKKASWVHVLGGLIALKLLLHLCLNGMWSFYRDELLYLALGRHLDWGFASVPPAIGFWGWLGGSVLGGSVEVVRLIATLFGTATVVLTALIAKEMLPKDSEQSSGKFAVGIVGLAGLTTSAFLRPAMLFMPVVFDIFYWTLLCFLFLKYLNTEKSPWLLWFGLAVGLGLLNKYTILIFLFAMLPGLVLTKQRRIFTNTQFYLAAGLALLVVAPNIAWQAAHKFPVFRHMSELASSQLQHVSLGDFLSDQFRMHLAALPLWLSGLYFLLFRKEAAAWRTFGWMYLMVLAVLIFFSGKSYYSLGAYPVLIGAGAAWLEQLTAQRRKWLRVALPVTMIVLGAITLPVALPFLQPEAEARLMEKLSKSAVFKGVLRWEDGKYYALPQDFSDMLGWEELAEITGKVWQNIPNKSAAAIYAENYGQAGAIVHFGKKYAVPEVLSFSDNYRYWLPDSLPANFQTLIYVNDELGDDMPGFFATIEKVGELNMPLSRQNGDQVYLCQRPTAVFFERINTAIARARSEEEIDR